MTAAVALAGFALATVLAVALVWAIGKLVAKTDKAADATVAVGATIEELERAGFERDAFKADAEESHRVAEHLAEELRNALANPPAGPVLAPGDVDSRVLRFYERYAAARAAREVRPGEDGLVHPGGDEAVAGGVPATDGSRAATARPGEP